MRWLALPVLVLGLAACGTAPKKSASPSSAPAGVAGTVAPARTATGKPCKVYAAAQEDPSTRGNYTAGGLYKPGVADTTPDYVPDVDCIPEPVVVNEPRSPVGNRSPYTVLGKQYRVLDRVDGYREQGIASYYGAKFHGRRTSNLEVYDMYAFTAAHKSLPLPSFARVTNLDNGASVVVRVNDRGPFHEGRVIDLSYAAAVKLGITQRGTGRVEVRALTPDGKGTQLASAAPPASRVAPEPATTPMDELVGRLPAASAAVAASVPATAATGHRYHVTPDLKRTPSADQFDAWMQANGVRVATGKPAAAASAPAAAVPATTVPGPAVSATATASNDAAKPVPASHAVAAGIAAIQLQVASFASRENADRALAQLSAAGIAGSLSDIISNGRKLWRLRVGAPDHSAAAELAGRIAGLGFGSPQWVRE
ncbi:septal ring lytic transglycosylase RlpA family protein [Pseudoxanthomonas wuyuanensis]|uniref:Endolytic peptidoglycan transglycosylase RlpA n=1 Tax=Pseudoxanthomonas wuyuanensis TaxID=1073196 RepID=A0A286D673_9GAMM|nr:septal ring lytic transglycosylase RlpA family protein [Pseudoxanthomonas wuyuanensis]KAF1721539.1 septal ring lytic transglycosylase RlpA family protein [Pseudoxanthomonas wuyuanensis]SOD54148.1 rare lipoprotein A [Pseudoxanthomonas wuyuanensis]